MGFLEDLIKTVQEAVDESREQQSGQPRRAPPAFPRRPSEPVPSQAEAEATATREHLHRRFLEAQRQEAESQARRQHQREHEMAVSVEERPSMAGAAHAAAAAGTAPSLSRATGWWRVAQLLDDRRSIREALLLKEILDKPLCLRGRFPQR